MGDLSDSERLYGVFHYQSCVTTNVMSRLDTRWFVPFTSLELMLYQTDPPLRSAESDEDEIPDLDEDSVVELDALDVLIDESESDNVPLSRSY